MISKMVNRKAIHTVVISHPTWETLGAVPFPYDYLEAPCYKNDLGV